MLNIKKQASQLLIIIKKSDYRTRGLFALFVIAIIVNLLIKKSLIHIETSDFTDFLHPWIQHLEAQGLAGLGSNFSNYNTPYLVLLWVVSHLPFSDVVSIKLISIFFDFVLASGVALVVSYFRPGSRAKYFAFLAVLYAPTVIQNGALWGQCDAIYSSFIVFAFYACLRSRLLLSWLLWGIAFSFKLQAIFFLPFLLFYMLYTRRAFMGPLVAAITIAILSCLPIFFGKSVYDVANIYIGQTAPPNGVQMLAWFSPTAYQWVSNTYFNEVRYAGILIGGMVALTGVSLAFLRKYTQTTILIIAALILTAVPFFMPQIHERYIFAGEIFMIIIAFVVPRFAWTAITMQIVSTMAYITFFTGANQMPPLPFALLSIAVFTILYAYAKYVVDTSLPVENKNRT